MIGKSIANRPYMYLPLKGDTNDYSTNAQNPSNTGVASTTGQFGESNGAYEWNATSDYLSWASSVGNSIAEKINIASTFCFFANITTGGRVFNQRGANPQGAFHYPVFVSNNLDTFTIDGTTGNLVTEVDFTSKYSSYYFHSIKSEQNASNVDIDYYLDAALQDTGTGQQALDTSTSVLRLGQDASSNSSFIGKIHSFRFYDVILSDGALKILNNEKGRIRA